MCNEKSFSPEEEKIGIDLPLEEHSPPQSPPPPPLPHKGDSCDFAIQINCGRCVMMMTI